MNEKEILLSRATDLKEKAADESVITHTNFLSPDEISTVSSVAAKINKYVNACLFGGYSEAERCVYIFIPRFYETDDIEKYFAENQDESPIHLIKITKDKFSTHSHRDYLGALMGLGIRREMLGDIVVADDGCFLFALKSISGYICKNLVSVGRGTVECRTVDLSSFTAGKDDFKELFLSVSSLRLDSIVSGAFGMSRSSASEEIKKGVVYVNSVKCLKNDFCIDEGDKIVLRGKGKAVLKEIVGESKKGRTHIKIKRYK